MVAVSVDESVDLVKQFFKSPDQGGRLPAGVTVAIDPEARADGPPLVLHGPGRLLPPTT